MSDHVPQILPSPDIERINFWKAQGLLTSIPIPLLLLVNWPALHLDDIVVGYQDGDYLSGPVRDFIEHGSSVIFKAGSSRQERETLRVILMELRGMQRAYDIMELDKNDKLKLCKTDVEKKQVKEEFKRDRKRILAPQIMLDAGINAFLDTMRFEVSELGLSELRQRVGQTRVEVTEERRRLDND